jgi:glycosyltransferase involved in cell wall biosynthesis
MKDAPIRVAHVVGSTGLYGAERWILALLRSIGNRGAECTIVNLVDDARETSAMVLAARARGLEAIDFPTGGRFNPLGVVRFAGWVRKNGIHLLHSHGYKSDVFSLLAGRLAFRKVLSTPHGWSKEEGDRKLKLYEALGRRCLRHMDQVCPLSPELREDLRKCGIREEGNRYIRNGVDLEEVDRVVAGSDKADGTRVIGYVGQLIERKNLPLLLSAFRKAGEHREDLELWILGEGPLRGRLAEICTELGIGDRVRFLGYREDGLTLVKQFDVFVLPSLLEGIPRCLMEAMALGIPVVASEIPGSTELVEHGRTGLLFPSDDPGRLADAMLRVLERPEDAREMCVRARTRIERDFSAARMAREYLSVYRCLAGAPGTAGV